MENSFAKRGARPLKGLALVTQTLLVAVGLHAFLAFMFVDFRLTTLFERAHVYLVLWLLFERSVDKSVR